MIVLQGKAYAQWMLSPDYATNHTNKVETKYCAVGGMELENVGEKRPQFSTNGVKTSMTFQATTKVKKPLAAASKITAEGNRIILDGAGSDYYNENQAIGARAPLKIENGVYTMEMLVSSPAKAAAPFQGRAK